MPNFRLVVHIYTHTHVQYVEIYTHVVSVSMLARLQTRQLERNGIEADFFLLDSARFSSLPASHNLFISFTWNISPPRQVTNHRFGFRAGVVLVCRSFHTQFHWLAGLVGWLTHVSAAVTQWDACSKFHLPSHSTTWNQGFRVETKILPHFSHSGSFCDSWESHGE